MRHDTRCQRHPHASAVRVNLVTKSGGLFQGAALFGGSPYDFLRYYGGANSTSARGIKTVFDRDVVIDDHSLNLNAFAAGEVGCHLEVHYVAGVVLDDMQHAFAAVHRLGSLMHLVWSRTRKDRSGTSGVQHSFANKPSMHRLVAAATAGYNANLALDRGIRSNDVIRVEMDLDQIGICGAEAGDRFENDVLGGIDELFHIKGGRRPW